MKVNTEKNQKNQEVFTSRYMFRDDDSNWWIGKELGKKQGWMKNETKSKIIPTTGWIVADSKNSTWLDDPTIKVEMGPLSFFCEMAIHIIWK